MKRQTSDKVILIGPIFVGIKDESRAGCLIICSKIIYKAIVTIIMVYADYTWLPLVIFMVLVFYLS